MNSEHTAHETRSYYQMEDTKTLEDLSVFIGKKIIVFHKDLARSPDTLHNLGGTSHDYRKWYFPLNKEDEIAEWVAMVKKGTAKHDYEEPQKPPKRQGVIKTVEWEVAEPVPGSLFRVEIIRTGGKGVPIKSIGTTRKVSRVERNSDGVVIRAYYKDRDLFLRGFGSNSFILIGNQWQLEGFKTPHTVKLMLSEAETEV